jgi:hypothetical protein
MKLATIAFVVLFAGGTVFAEPKKTIRNSGPVTNRINMVILGDGYRKQDLPDYARHVDDFVKRLFSQSPYSGYATYFNIVRVDVQSVDKGASHPEIGVMRNTAFGASYNCQNIQRLVCVDQSKVDAVVSRNVPANAEEFVVIIVNDTTYGGSGGWNAIASIDPNALDIVAHELGHTIGLLADEYDSEPPTCDPSPPAEPNVTDDFRLRPKWPLWVGATTVLPTTGIAPGVPGAYKGARNCRDMFRPTFGSKMRMLDRPFEQINTEQLILRFYNYVYPIDSVTPVETLMTASCGGPSAKLQVHTPQPVGRSLSVTWRIDGVVVGTSPSLIVQTSGLSTGSHTVDLEVSDTTPAVKNDPSHRLTDRRQWNLTLKGRGRTGGPGGC